MFKPYSDQQIIESIRAGGLKREKAWEFIYKDWRDKLISHISHKGGSKEEALEAIQAAYMGFQQRICKPDFRIRHKLADYFLACVYHEWVNARKKKVKVTTVELEEYHLHEFIENTDTGIEKNELSDAIQESLMRIGERCKKILLLFYDEYSMKEIAEIMGFQGGEQVAKNEKMKCMARYENLLRQNPDIMQHLKNLKND